MGMGQDRTTPNVGWTSNNRVNLRFVLGQRTRVLTPLLHVKGSKHFFSGISIPPSVGSLFDGYKKPKDDKDGGMPVPLMEKQMMFSPLPKGVLSFGKGMRGYPLNHVCGMI